MNNLETIKKENESLVDDYEKICDKYSLSYLKTIDGIMPCLKNVIKDIIEIDKIGDNKFDNISD